MSIFKKAISYLTGKKELQDQIDKLNETAITNQQLIQAVQSIEAQKKPCVNKLVYNCNNKTLQVISCSGDTYAGFNIEPDQLESFRNADNETIIALLSPKKEETISNSNVEEQEKELVSNFLDIFDGVDDFEVLGNSVYFKGVKSVEIPSLIIARFVELIEKHRDSVDEQIQWDYLQEDEEYNALKSFTLKLLLNPLSSSREQLLTFIRKNNVTITSKGNLILYRACYEGNNADELVKFVAKEYLKIKAWKKAPSQYEVYDDNGYVAVHTDKLNGYNKHVGNLAELYSKLPEMQKNGKQYYSSHGKKKMVIGDIYKIDDSEVDLDASVCASGGLHAASVNYDYSGFGDTNLVVLINPAKTITVPTHDFGKMRVSEMMIVGINPNERGVHISEDFYADLDDNYHNYSLEELEHALQNKSVESVSISNALSEVSLKDVENIKNLLNKRVVNI